MKTIILLKKIGFTFNLYYAKKPSKKSKLKLYNRYYVTCVGPIENSAASSWKQQRDALEDLILFSGVLLSCLTKSSIFPSSTNKGNSNYEMFFRLFILWPCIKCLQLREYLKDNWNKDFIIVSQNLIGLYSWI